MKTTVEPLEGNKVKLSVEVDEAEFEKAIDAAFRKIAREVRIPGFRPGKAPRRLLEARVGTEVARQEALRDSLPDYYVQALKETDVDAIAPPEIDITAGEESGAIAFDAVVQIRPQLQLPGYGGIKATVPSPVVTDTEIDNQIDRLRQSFGELTTVDRPSRDGDHLSIDITGSRDGEPVEGLTASDFLYELGSGAVIGQLDEQLQGVKPGDIVEFTAPIPGQDDEVSFKVLVKEVKEKVLPEVTDEWASEASEFETVDELRDDLRKRIGMVKKMQAQMALRDAVLAQLVELVDEEPPEVLVGQELESRIHDLGHNLDHRGITLPQYLDSIGRSQDELLADLRNAALQAVKADLALRAVAEHEALEVSDEDVESEIERVAARTGQKVDQIRKQLERAEQLPAVRSDLKKGKALEWLVTHCEVVDEEGNPIDRADLELPSPESQGTAEEPGETE